MKNLFRNLTAVALAQTTVACLAPMVVEIKPELADKADEITQEVFDVVDFLQETYDLDAKKWELGLKVVIYDGNLGAIECPANLPDSSKCFIGGLYWHNKNLVEVGWRKGSCNNSLIHELMHRMSYVKGYGDPFFGEVDRPSPGISHNPLFHEYTEEAKRLWRKERGCE